MSGSTEVPTQCTTDPVRRDSDVGPTYCESDGAGSIYLPTVTTKRIVFENAPDFPIRDYRTHDFAFSVIVAHEWGHHVQKQLGRRDAAFRLTRPSIRVELQADCLAGVWAYSTWRRALLDRTDIPEALAVASSAGDRPGVAPGDRLRPRHRRAAAHLVHARLRGRQDRLVRHESGRHPLAGDRSWIRRSRASPVPPLWASRPTARS